MDLAHRQGSQGLAPLFAVLRNENLAGELLDRVLLIGSIPEVVLSRHHSEEAPAEEDEGGNGVISHPVPARYLPQL